MFNPRYSILLCNHSHNISPEQVGSWLKSGIKVFWFGDAASAENLKRMYQPFASAYLLQCFVTKQTSQLAVVDGKIQNTDALKKLNAENKWFNLEQYLVEHCLADKNIVVEASAGTGKTTVMIDRIMYLIHMLDDLKLSDIYMITFTNAATDEMNKRLQGMLLTRYRLTGDQRYLRWLEGQSQMHISTIDSFAYDLLRRYGIARGFSDSVSIRTLTYEKRELIKDTLNQVLNRKQPVNAQMGLSFYQGVSTIEFFWEKLNQMGFSVDEILKMDWSSGADAPSEHFQRILLQALEEVDETYRNLKQRTDSVTLTDILGDLMYVLEGTDPETMDLSMRYLFVDEFQDSDNSQIKVLSWLVKHCNTGLFVVGDIKQSIYRFRGATDTAFSSLTENLKALNLGTPAFFSLQNNYRTSANVLNSLNSLFHQWDEENLLRYSRDVIPMNDAAGELDMPHSIGRYSFADEFKDIADHALEECANRIRRKGKINPDKDRVVVLTRSNLQAITIGEICEQKHIPAIVKKKGSFYTCEAVRDFYAMLSSFIFAGEPKYAFEYLMTPYANIDARLDLEHLQGMNGNLQMLRSELQSALETCSWAEYAKKFRLFPVMSVLKEIVDEEPIIENYIARAKQKKLNQGWSDEKCRTAVLAESKQYQANLNKLIEILQRNMNGESTDIYDIYSFLKLSIATDREEEEADVEDNVDYHCLYCMTVHKAKGLEFDTVIIPYTNHAFIIPNRSEVLVNNAHDRIGWLYVSKDKQTQLSNQTYAEVRKEEDLAVDQEETRILYVAMTRAINSLYCLISPAKGKHNWTYLLEMGEDHR